MSARIEFIIDELVLHGFSPTERYAIGEALSLELQRLAVTSGPGGLTSLKDASSLRASDLTLQPGAKPAALGAQIAGAVHGSLSAGQKAGAK